MGAFDTIKHGTKLWSRSVLQCGTGCKASGDSEGRLCHPYLGCFVMRRTRIAPTQTCGAFKCPRRSPPTPTLHICTPRENCYTNNNLTHTAHIHRLYLCKKVRARIEQAERFCDFTKLPTRRPGKRGKPACVPCVSGPAQFPRY